MDIETRRTLPAPRAGSASFSEGNARQRFKPTADVSASDNLDDSQIQTTLKADTDAEEYNKESASTSATKRWTCSRKSGLRIKGVKWCPAVVLAWIPLCLLLILFIIVFGAGLLIAFYLTSASFSLLAQESTANMTTWQMEGRPFIEYIEAEESLFGLAGKSIKIDVDFPIETFNPSLISIHVVHYGLSLRYVPLTVSKAFGFLEACVSNNKGGPLTMAEILAGCGLNRTTKSWTSLLDKNDHQEFNELLKKYGSDEKEKGDSQLREGQLSYPLYPLSISHSNNLMEASVVWPEISPVDVAFASSSKDRPSRPENNGIEIVWKEEGRGSRRWRRGINSSLSWADVYMLQERSVDRPFPLPLGITPTPAPRAKGRKMMDIKVTIDIHSNVTQENLKEIMMDVVKSLIILCNEEELIFRGCSRSSLQSAEESVARILGAVSVDFALPPESRWVMDPLLGAILPKGRSSGLSLKIYQEVPRQNTEFDEVSKWGSQVIILV